MVRADGTGSAKVIKVIETRAKRGLGTEKDPEREIVQYWALDGTFLAEMDTENCIPIVMNEAQAIKDSIA